MTGLELPAPPQPARARRDWLLPALLVAVGLAWLKPSIGASGGPLHPQATVAAAVALTFLASGLALPTRALTTAAGHWRLHLFIQVFVFLVVPFLVVLATPILRAQKLALPVAVAEGFTILACVPSTITSASVFTRVAGGNEAAALCNAVLSALIGIVATPALLAALIGFSAQMPVGLVVRDLAVQVALPLVAGQALGWCWPRLRERAAPVLRAIPTACIVYIVYTVFCRAFAAPLPGMTARALVGTVSCVCGLHAVVLVVCWRLSGLQVLGFAWADRVCALYSGSQKTLALGLPLIQIIFGQDPDLRQTGDVAWMSLPLMLYHPLQTLVAGLLVPWLKKGQASEGQAPGVVKPQ